MQVFVETYNPELIEQETGEWDGKTRVSIKD